jgi:hypothetical protein
MRNLNILLFFLCIRLLSFSQNWQQVYDIIDEPAPVFMRAANFYSENYGATINLYGGTTGPLSHGTRVSITKDGGLTWDSTQFAATATALNSLQMPNDSIIYFVFVEEFYEPGQFFYAKQGIKRSMDQGDTWTTHWFDSTLNNVGQSQENDLVFLNDSMGVFIGAGFVLYTGDYGESWSEIYSTTATNAGVTEDKFLLYNYGYLHIYDPFAGVFTTQTYPANCEGQVYYSNFRNQTAYRALYAQDGPQQGYTANNYSVIIIDELPFGDQRVIHFPNQGYFECLELTENGLFLSLAGWMIRSMDNGITFERMPAVDSTTGINFLSMLNDTVGYAVCSSYGAGVNPNYSLWKTTNGGGVSGVPVVTNSFIGGVGVNELENEILFEVFPNPSHGQFSIRSSTEIETVELFALDGRKCLQKKVNKTKLDVNTDNLAIGTYLLRIKTKTGETGIRKIIIE